MDLKKTLSTILAASMLLSPIGGAYADQLDDLNKETDKLWRRGRGAEDGAFTASATSMIAWGVGIGAAAALLAILIKGSSGGGGGGHAHCFH